MAEQPEKEVKVDSLGGERLPDEPLPVQPPVLSEAEVKAQEAEAQKQKEAEAKAQEAEKEVRAIVSEGLTEGEEPPKPGDIKYTRKVKERIDRITREKHDVERDRDYWKQEAQKRQGPTAEPVKPVVVLDTSEPKEDAFETHTDYVKALASWQFRKDKALADEETAKVTAAEAGQRLMTTFKERVASSKILERHSDFEELTQTRGYYTPEMSRLVYQDENGPDLAYYLATHVEESKRISEMSDAEAGRELGRLSERITLRGKKQPTIPAAEPINPLIGHDVVEKDIGEMSQSEYEAMRAKQIKARQTV